MPSTLYTIHNHTLKPDKDIPLFCCVLHIHRTLTCFSTNESQHIFLFHDPGPTPINTPLFTQIAKYSPWDIKPVLWMSTKKLTEFLPATCDSGKKASICITSWINYISQVPELTDMGTESCSTPKTNYFLWSSPDPTGPLWTQPLNVQHMSYFQHPTQNQFFNSSSNAFYLCHWLQH